MQNLDGGFGSQIGSNHIGGLDMLTGSTQTARLITPADGSHLGLLSAAKGSDNLNALRKGSVSGIITVLIALKWWAPPDHDDKDWEAVVEDVTSCLQHMTNTSAGTKRKSDEEEPISKKKRYYIVHKQ